MQRQCWVDPCPRDSTDLIQPPPRLSENITGTWEHRYFPLSPLGSIHLHYPSLPPFAGDPALHCSGTEKTTQTRQKREKEENTLLCTLSDLISHQLTCIHSLCSSAACTLQEPAQSQGPGSKT